MTPRFELATVCIDCDDPHAMAGFYGQLLGLEIAGSEPDWVLLRDPKGGTALSFQRESWYRAPTWPEEPGRLPKMMHLDVYVDDLETATARAVELGARLAEHQPQDLVRVLFDPAGHPFCLFVESG